MISKSYFLKIHSTFFWGFRVLICLSIVFHKNKAAILGMRIQVKVAL